MFRLLVSTYKEILLLLRDWGGLAILFVMPSALLITITVIQDSTFKAVGEAHIPVILVDEDQGEIGKLVIDQIEKNPSVSLILEYNNKPIDKESARELVAAGDYQIAMIIPEGVSDELNNKVNSNVANILEQFSLQEETDQKPEEPITIHPKEIEIFFDPAAGQSFRNSIKNTVEQILAKIESNKIYTVFQEHMGIENMPELMAQDIISFQEVIAQKGNDGLIPNAVQHNVPAWILFGIFFIVVPLSINIVKEKNLGTSIRLNTSPVPYLIILGGKIITYSIICLVQFFLMLLIATFFFPLIGLIPFESNGVLTTLIIIAIIAGLAAIGLGILIGTIAQTQEQSAPFGAILVIILAALGGVWVPTFIMPPFMQKVALFSPMNWGLEAFYTVILRNGTIVDIKYELLFLLLFFMAMIAGALIYNKYKRAL